MILVSQDGFKAFNMKYIKSYLIYEDKFGNLPTFSATDEYHEYAIWIDPNPYWETKSLYTIGKFKRLEDAQKVFMKLTSILDPDAPGRVVVTENDVDFFQKNYWTREVEKNADNQE